MRLRAKLATVAILAVVAGRSLGAVGVPVPFISRQTLNPPTEIEPAFPEPLPKEVRDAPGQSHGQSLTQPGHEPANPDMNPAWTFYGIRGPRWRSIRFYFGLALIIVALTLCEWRWMIAREKQLRSLVMERTRELEAEKTELLRAKAALVKLASLDSLTGLYNRATILEVLDYELKRCWREKAPFAIVLTDLDNFKSVNDTYGHLAGDSVLREFARRIQRSLRPYDYVGRYGGEELLLLMPGMKEEAASRIQELHHRVTSQPFAFGEVTLHVTCSFGVSWFPSASNTVEALLSLADQALYLAKANGRNRVEITEQLAFVPATADAKIYNDA